MTQQEINSIIEDYKNGMTLNDTIKKYHHKYSTIKKILIDNGINVRTKSEAGKGIKKKKVSSYVEEKIVENYLSGMGLISSGKELGVSGPIVRRILVKRGIHIRDYAESASIQNSLRKKYSCDLDYFKKETPEMAYILGFLAADGSVALKSNVIKISLAKKDKELLEKFVEQLKFTGKVKEATTNSGFDIATLNITCREYKEDLAKYNIIPQKTYTFSFPKNLDKKYWIDFIRGYWDGDGTICTAGKEAIRASLCSYRKEFLQDVIDFFEAEYDIPKVTIHKKKESNVYYFQYSNNSTIKLYKALYYKPELLCLKRKKEKFELLCADDNLSTRQRVLQLKD